MARKLSKATIKKGHRIAKAIMRGHSKVRSAYAVGMAAAMKSSRKRSRKRRR